MDDILIDEVVEAGEPVEVNLATVTAVTAEGIQIRIDGDEQASSKTYPCNSGARFQTGQRVRIKPDSGTYIVEYPVGAPMATYPIPSGGSANQVLAKASGTSYDLKWVTMAEAHGIPSGGTDGQVLTKNGTVDYSVKWAAVPHELPTGGSDGQVLTKNGTANYSVKWAAAPSPTGLANGSKSISLGTNGYLTQSGSVELGSSSSPFAGLAISGQIRLGTSSYGTTLGFFGTSPVSRQAVSSTASVATLITALKAYGLIS